jgi:hypothetical protein
MRVATKTVVFVQGGKKNEEAYPWMFFHLDPFTEPKPEPVDLVFFDYPAGTMKVWKNHTLKRGKKPTAAPDSETELTPKVKIRLADGTTDDANPDRASVLALYDWVKTQPKGSIRSLQVFSHGWMGGPIIWNSSEFDPDGNHMEALDEQDRDPNDTDFRMRDFVGSNPLAGAEGRKFADAFASDALIKLWGCVAPEGIRGQMQRFVRAPKGTRGDATRQAHLQDYLDSISRSFPMEMAVRLGLAVWASPIGFGSEPGAKVPTNRGEISVKYRGAFPPDLKKDRWWRVSWFFRNQDGGARFYQDVLKARVDAVDFVEHKKSWFEDARRTAVLSALPSAVSTPLELFHQISERVESLFP